MWWKANKHARSKSQKNKCLKMLKQHVYREALLCTNQRTAHQWCLRRRTTRTVGRPQPPSSRSCCSDRKEARRRRSSWPASDMRTPGNTAVQKVNVVWTTPSFHQDLSCVAARRGLTGITPGRRKAWQKPMAWEDSAGGSSSCWIEWRCLLYTSTSSSSSFIRGRWLSVSVSTGPSTVSDSMLKPGTQGSKGFSLHQFLFPTQSVIRVQKGRSEGIRSTSSKGSKKHHFG